MAFNKVSTEPLVLEASGRTAFTVKPEYQPLVTDEDRLGISAEQEVRRHLRHDRASFTERALYGEVVALRKACWDYARRLAVAWPEQERDLVDEVSRITGTGPR